MGKKAKSSSKEPKAISPKKQVVKEPVVEEMKSNWIPEHIKIEQTVQPKREVKIFNANNHGRIVSGTEAPETKDMIFAGDVLVEDPNIVKPVKQVTECPKKILVGRNKSGCLWKKGTSGKNSNTVVSLNRKSWDKKVEERKQKKALQQRLMECREKQKTMKSNSIKAWREKQERKKLNEMRSAKYQVIKNLAKTKKWTKKAKSTLAKLPAEIFYEKFK